jgi:two-component system LytT family response regulator
MTWSAYVVDDEPLAVDRLVRLLETTGRVAIAGSTTSPRTARAFLRTHPVDVLFLDITMPGMNGFELLAGLATPPCVIFTTAYDQFALKAFEVNSIDYLLKPIEMTHLERALDKFERLGGRQPRFVDLQKVCAEIVDALRARSSAYAERLASRLGDRVCFIDVSQVTHLYAEDKLTYAMVDGRAHGIDAPLSELEQRLDPKSFIRIHRATVVNARWVGEIKSGRNLVLQLKDEKRTQLSVARSRTAAVKERLGL